MEQPDISEARLENLLSKVNDKAKLRSYDYRDMVLALQELKDRREWEKGAKFMSKSGDWLLALILAGVVGYGVWVCYTSW